MSSIVADPKHTLGASLESLATLTNSISGDVSSIRTSLETDVINTPGPSSARCNMPLPTTAKPGAHAVLGPAAWPSIVGGPGGGCAMILARLRRMQAAAVSAHATPKRLGSLQAVLVLCLCVMQVAPRRKFCMPECSTCISGAYSIEHVHY